MSRLKRLLIVLVLLGAGNLLWQLLGELSFYTERLNGRIAYVYDGDTIRIGKTRIRLWGVDAPELETKAGRKARDWAVKAWEGKQARCRKMGTTRGRVAARCTIGSSDMGRQIIRAGHACEWRRYSRGYYSQRMTCERLGRR